MDLLDVSLFVSKNNHETLLENSGLRYLGDAPNNKIFPLAFYDENKTTKLNQGIFVYIIISSEFRASTNEPLEPSH